MLSAIRCSTWRPGRFVSTLWLGQTDGETLRVISPNQFWLRFACWLDRWTIPLFLLPHDFPLFHTNTTWFRPKITYYIKFFLAWSGKKYCQYSCGEMSRISPIDCISCASKGLCPDIRADMVDGEMPACRATSRCVMSFSNILIRSALYGVRMMTTSNFVLNIWMLLHLTNIYTKIASFEPSG